MRIAIYHNLTSGGAKRTTFEQVKRLSRKHAVDVYSLGSANHEFADLRPVVRQHIIFKFTPARLMTSPWGRINQAIRILDLARLNRLGQKAAQTVDQNGYDLLLAHPCQFENSPSVLNFLASVRSVYYCHEPLRLIYETMPARPYDQAELGRRRVLNRIDPLPWAFQNALKQRDRRNIRRAGKVIVNSEFVRNSVRSIYGLEPKVSYHGVDTELFRPLGIEKRPILLSVGSLTPLKGFDFLIQSLSRLPAAARPVLHIASNFQNPPERDYLIGLAKEMQVSVELESNVGDARLVELYNQAIATVYAPLAEPFGLVPLESMASGTPVVAVDEGGIRESVIHERTGFLTQRDPELFAQAVSRLLADRRLAMTLGQNGREHAVSHWSWDQAVSTLEQYLEA